MRVVIADTGPIYYLVLIDRAEILPALFTRLIIPSVVMAELTHAETPAKVREWVGRAPGWLEVHDVPIDPIRDDDPAIEKLDAGLVLLRIATHPLRSRLNKHP